MMYSRVFEEPPAHIIENGRAHFGTFKNVSQRFDIKGMRAPYAGIPLPSILSNIRIKSRLNYYFSIDKYIGLVEFFDFKIIGLVEVCFWNKETGKKYVYHSIMPTRRRFIPKNTGRGICASYKKSKYIRIFWEKEHQIKTMRFHVNKASGWPAAEGWFHSVRDDNMRAEMSFVNPAPTLSRCSALWLSTMKINGHLAIKGSEPDNSSGIAAMAMNRYYSKTLSKALRVCGMGNIDGKDIFFYMDASSSEATDPDKYNDNALIVDGEKSALPSIVATHPFGLNKAWIIQDTESMIDLTFTPKSLYWRNMNLILLRAAYSHIYGTFEGVLLDKDGNKIQLKNFTGIITRSSMRV
ncbi:MAG: DUF2804 domain-containing protein [Treponema sp.]|nr:DUF2804 domain-containing protein [Treponema sp.]